MAGRRAYYPFDQSSYFDEYQQAAMERETEEFMRYVERRIESELPPESTCIVLDDPQAPADQEAEPQGAAGGDVSMKSPEHPSTSADSTATVSTSAEAMATSAETIPTSPDSVTTTAAPISTEAMSASAVKTVPTTSTDTVATSAKPKVVTPEAPRSPSGSAAADSKSPKRKAEDEGPESPDQMDTDDSGEPAAKEARTEGADEGADAEVEEGEGEFPRKDVAELIHALSRYLRHPFSPQRVRLYNRMPREMVAEISQELHYRDLYFRQAYRRRAGDRRDRRKQEESDQDSGDEVQPQEPGTAGSKFLVSEQQQLLRLLILGAPTKVQARTGRGDDDPFKNINYTHGVITRMLQAGRGAEVVEIIKDVSVKGRSPRQDGVIYALARCCRCQDISTKRAAYDAIKDMCRTPTQLFQLIGFIEGLDENTTGWGRGLRHAVCHWYNSNSSNPLRLAMQITKYWSRQTWCHRDVFRLAHIKPVDDVIGFIVRYAVKGLEEAEKFYLEDGYLGQTNLEKVHKYLKGVEEARHCLDKDRALQLIQEHDLVREQLRTELLNEPAIWGAMLRDMPLTALVRNLNKMTAVKLFEDVEMQQVVRQKLMNVEAMRKARVHPFKLLLAHHIYRQGHGEKGSLQWQPNPEILEALEQAFYTSFGTVEPTGKRILIALDISGSMSSLILDSPVQIREAATLMAMVTARRETNCDIVGFHNKLVPLDMFRNPSKKLDDLVYETKMLGFGSTDCAKPMTWARHKNKPYDVFIIYTDSETNSNRVPPWFALKKYREKMGLPNAKLIVVGMAGYDFSIASPADVNMLDVVGFDTETPGLIREFIMGTLE